MNSKKLIIQEIESLSPEMLDEAVEALKLAVQEINSRLVGETSA
jgi:hypothetical protein